MPIANHISWFALVTYQRSGARFPSTFTHYSELIMEVSNKPQRVYWIDSLRFIAIFLVYIGHLGPSAGRIYSFVYLFHVPLFFFISGMFYKSGGGIADNVKSSFKKLMIPYFVYSLASLIVYTLFLQKDMVSVQQYVIQLLEAKRNFTEYAVQMWFLPCMFLIMIFFHTMKSLIKSDIIVFALCIVMMSLSVYVPDVPSSVVPKLPYSLDSAFFYISWYAIGYYCRGWFISFFSRTGVTQVAMYVIAMAFAVMCFFGLHHDPENYITLIVGGKTYVILWMIPTFLLFISLIPIAKILSSYHPVLYMGRNTLQLCCIESIAKISFISLIGISGHSLNIGDEYYSFVYISVLMLLIYMAKTKLDEWKSKTPV